MTDHPDPTHFDAIVIGAGFSGLAHLHHLRDAGLDVVAVDSQDGVGGTWWINTYPGVRTDSEFHYYSYSFSKEVREEWRWTERYASGPEVCDYLNFVADRLELRPHIRLNTTVTSATYDETANVWHVELEGQPKLTARYLVSGMGILAEPVYPAIPGIEDFAGELYHTARWPREGADLSGKRVGIIGVGASGIQLIPTVAKQAGELIVFQRTPQYVVETTNEPVSDEWMREVRENYDEIFEKAAAHPFGVAMDYADKSALAVEDDERRRIFESKWMDGGFHFANECFNDLATDIRSAELASDFIRSKIREIVNDPRTADLLCPTTYAFNGKRVPTGHNYYATFNRSNVRLVDVKSTPITRISERGVVVNDKEYELDVLVLATGFDAMTGTLTAIDIVGREGVVLRDRWNREGVRTTLGVAVAGFPNFFMSLGPQTPYSSIPVPIQLGAQWLQRLIQWAEQNGIETLETTTEAEDRWFEETHRAGHATVMAAEGEKAGAWFLGHNVDGKPRGFLVYMGGGQVYQDFCREAEANGYSDFVPAATRAAVDA